MAIPDDDSIRAGELVLGLLEGDERAAALRQTLRDPDFAAEVERWRIRLAGLFEEAATATPPATLEERIVGATEIDSRRGGVAPVWRTLTAIATLIAACLVLALFLKPAPIQVAPPRPAPVEAPQPMLAAMTRTDGGKPFAALYDRAAGTVRLTGAQDWPAGRSAELWVIAGKAAPVSLGVLDAGNRVALATARKAGIAPGQVLAISIEPVGGSPTGAPTGPVVATGELEVG